MSRPNNIKAAFLQFCGERECNPETLREAEAIGLLKAFYDDVGFDGRKRGTNDDKLLLETTHPPGDDPWSVRVSRQLYKTGHGIRLSLLWTYGGPSFLANATVDSGGDGSAAWAADALKEVSALRVENKKPASFDISMDTF